MILINKYIEMHGQQNIKQSTHLYYLRIWPLSFAPDLKSLPDLLRVGPSTPYSNIGLTSAIQAKRFVLLCPFFSIRIMK